MTNIRVESNSSVNTYKTCPAKYAYHYGPQKRYVKPTDAMQLGNLVHEALAFALKHDGSKEAALSYLDTCFTNDVEKAKAVISYYMPRIGPVKPYLLDGKPVIEKKFNVEVAGVKMLGYIDAVIYDHYNNVVLVDWKTRAGLLDSAQLALDNQLYIYVYVAREILGIPVDKACQVQMSTTLPAKPKLLKSKVTVKYQAKPGTETLITWGDDLITKKVYGELTDRSKADFMKVEIESPPELSKVLGKTTMTAFIDEVQRLGVSDQVDLNDYKHKFVDENEFLRMSYIDVDKASLKTENFILWVNRIQNDELMLPVANSSVCKWCQYTDLCLDK